MLIVCYPDLRLLVMNKSAVSYIRKIAYFLFQTAFRRKVEILQSLHTYRLWCWRLCLARWWNGGTKTETVEVQHHSTTLSRAQSILSCRYIYVSTKHVTVRDRCTSQEASLVKTARCFSACSKSYKLYKS